MTETKLPLNLEDTKRFFRFLAHNENETFTGYIAEESEDFRMLRGHVFGTYESLCVDLIGYESEEFPTLHICLNRTNDKGRKKADVQSVRVLCVDLDRPLDKCDIRAIKDKLSPDLIVESSECKYHVYWKIDSTIPLSVWEDFQLGLAYHFGSDFNLAQPNHTIRVPGFPRITKSGDVWVPRIVWLKAEEDMKSMSFQDVKSHFEGIDDWTTAAKLQIQERRKSQRKLNSAKPLTKKDKKILSESRNQSIFEAVMQKVMSGIGKKAPVSLEEAEEYAVALEIELTHESGKASMEKSEIEKTVRSAYRQAHETIEREDEKKSESHKKVKESQGVVEFNYDFTGDESLKENRFSEMSITSRLLQRFGERVVRSSRRVYAFNSGEMTWQVQCGDDQSTLYGFTHEVLMDVLHDPKFIDEMCMNESGEYSKAAHTRAKDKFTRLGLVEKVVKSVIHSPKVRKIKFDNFDANPYLVFCENGCLNLLTQELREPTPEDYMLNRTGIAWDSTAECPRWIEFLGEVFAENDDPHAMVLFMQELFGYSISGLISAQKIFCHYGDGSNGKSKVMKALGSLGGDYSARLAPDDIVSKRNTQAKAMERIGAKIEGHRIVIVDDISVNTVWDEGFVKNLTDSTIIARAEYERSREFSNRATIHMGLNQAPTPEGENHGILRRMCIIPYVRRFVHTPGTSDRIDGIIESEKAGILKWACEGLARYVERDGFLYPNELEQAVEEYKEQHFTGETAVNDLLRIKNPGEIAEPVFLTDLVEEINEYLRQAGESNREFNTDTLGAAIKRNLKVSPKKMWCPKRRNSFKTYQVVRLYNPIKTKHYSSLV